MNILITGAAGFIGSQLAYKFIKANHNVTLVDNMSYGHEDNLLFTEKIQKKIEEYYPSLSKGIYQKSGYGVNGIYNQDFSNHTILIEIGGYENTTSEVLNSSLAFAKCFMEVIHE